ncbi:MAG: tetratricopeptide repeat protein [Candidatus Goldbacteria bacterium]|nr:tetratricopeptide repeat protein [Candidatus Goldiibacteriota bacterium]
MKKTFIKRLLTAVLAVFLSSAVFASVEEYKKAVELDGNNVVKRFNLGLAYYNENRHDEALDTMKKVLEINKDDKASHEKVDFSAAQIAGIIYYNFKNNDDEAIKYFDKASQLNPADGANYFYAGLAYLRKENLDKAIEAFTKSIEKKYDEMSEAYFRLGQSYYKKNIFGDALINFEKCIDIKPKHLECRELLGLIYHKRENADKAIENLKEVVKANPENFNAQYLLGLNYFKKKEYDKMITAYKKAININPNFSDAHYNLGMAYYYRNMYKEAIEELETAKKLNPGDSSTFSLLAQVKTTGYDYYLSSGTTYLTEEEFLKAKEQFTLALKVKPGDSEAQKYLSSVNESISKQVPDYLEKGKKAFEAGDVGGAYNAWYYVLQVNPDNGEAKDGMAKVEKNISELISAKEKQAKLYLNQEKYTEAVDEYYELKKLLTGAKAKAVDEKIRAARASRDAKIKALLIQAEKFFSGSDKKVKQDYRKALQKFNDVLKYDSGNSSARDGITKVNQKIEADKDKYLSLARQNKSSPEKAKSYYQKVLAIDPNNEEANSGIEKLTGTQSKASVDAKALKSLYYEGVDKYVNGEIEAAIAVWGKVIAMDPGHAEAKKNIARAREKLAAIKKLSR